jgi:sulfite exporter TauE/SafE
MNASLILSSFFMGVVGGPHCLAMCGAACVAIKEFSQTSGQLRFTCFLLARLLGYASLGALAAQSVQGIGWLSVHSAVFRPVWALLHVTSFFVGLMLVLKAQEPIWLSDFAKSTWMRVSGSEFIRKRSSFKWVGAMVLGYVWALLPCGLLYSALWIAALSANAAQGALVMSAFALGSALVLMMGPSLWRLLKKSPQLRYISLKEKIISTQIDNTSIVQSNSSGAIGIRIAGGALMIVSTFDLWMGLVQNKAPWCVSSLT